MDRVVQVAGGLARNSRHRGAKPVDLVIAAGAEAAGLSVLQCDSGHDRIAAVTNQPTEWICPAGTPD
jgi:predicted nucleic acid-binding protein